MDKEIELSAGIVRYHDVGQGEPIVFVHGLLVSSALWRKVVPPLSRTHRCIVPDWPLGSHPVALKPDADVSPLAVAAMIAEFLDALGLEDVTLVGNDSGGGLCQLVVTRHPRRIGRLVLTTCDAFEVFPPKAFKYLAWVVRVPGLMRALVWAMLRFPSLRQLSIAYGALTRERLPDEITAGYLQPGSEDAGVRRDVGKFLIGMTPRLTLDAAAALPRFDRPTLIVWSKSDRFFPLTLGERLHAAISRSRLVVLDDARVFVPEDQPERLVAEIERFLGEEPGRAAS
jgi:pimeloyl-ACP methyl ester carboxylesterase